MKRSNQTAAAETEDDELAIADRELAAAIIDMLRPYHLQIRDLRRILCMAYELLDCVVLQEKAPERK